MRFQEANPDEQLQAALQELRQHQLASDTDLKKHIDTRWLQEKRRFWWRTGIGAAVASIVMGGALFKISSPSYTGLKIVALLLVFPLLFLLIGWGMSFRQHQQRKQALNKAQEAIDRRDYSSRSLVTAFRGSRSDITPLKQDDWNWRGVSDAVRKEEDQELSTIWAQWLLSDFPIREMDVEAIQRVIRTKKKATEWHAQRQASHQQQEGRQMALEALPPELVSSLKGDLLEQRLVPAIADGPKPRL